MYPESQLLPISALQHLRFCERQCALIHVEGLWAENRLTIEGRVLHDKAHDGRSETRPGVRIARGVGLRSLRLGLVGQADVVEFRQAPRTEADPPGSTATARQSASASASTPSLTCAPAWAAFSSSSDGQRWIPYPVEYKRGRPKKDGSDRVQLCAQGLCLEEMLAMPGEVAEGALYYGRTRRRQVVPLDAALRELTERTARRLHELIAGGVTPKARREPKCERCSLLHLCLPGALRPRRTANRWLSGALDASLSATQGQAGLDDE